MKRVGVMLMCLIVSLGLSLSCNEALPVYLSPENVLTIRMSEMEQLDDRHAPPENQVVHLEVAAENIFDEPFLDSVHIAGSMRIWWKRKPGRFRTIYLSEKNFTQRDLIHNGRMLLLPGQRITFEAYWNLKSDDSLYLPSEMDFSRLRQRSCYINVACSDPETFVVETALKIYDRLGYVTAPAAEFTFIGRVCIICGYGPSCPPPPPPRRC